MLLPNDPDSHYRAMEIVGPEQLDRLQVATVVVTNHHAFIRRETIDASSLWLQGLLTVRDKIGIRRVFDLSATPFFLRGSGYPEGALFPWVVSDFSLMDAIKSGMVKVPRVPVSDDSTGSGPTYRDLWLRVRDDLPKKGVQDTGIERAGHPDGA